MDATSLTAEQADIYVDEYAPFNMGPLTDTLPIVYGGTLPGPFDLVTVSPNCLRWHLGTLKPHTLWSATFRIKVQNIVFSGTQNNLANLAGYNTEGLAFSERDQVAVKFGEPNINLSKTIDPPTSVVKPGESYTYSIVISNLQNADNTTTDAYHMTITDVIPTSMTLKGISVSGSGSYNPPVTTGQTSPCSSGILHPEIS